MAGQAAWVAVARAVSSAIAAGRIPAGDRLPPLERVARALGVGRDSVRRAWDALERAGWIERRGRAEWRARPPAAAAKAAPGAGPDLAPVAAALGLRVGARGLAARGGLLAPGGGAEASLAAGRIPRRRRVWLAYRLRAAIRHALLAGMSGEEIEEVFRAACAWERIEEALAGARRLAPLLSTPVAGGAGRGDRPTVRPVRLDLDDPLC